METVRVHYEVSYNLKFSRIREMSQTEEHILPVIRDRYQDNEKHLETGKNVRIELFGSLWLAYYILRGFLAISK